MFNSPLQQVVRHDKYAKWIPELNRRETWPETVERVMDFLMEQLKIQGCEIPVRIEQQLAYGMLELDVMPSMRIVQMAGPALDRCHVGGYNCAYLPLTSPQDLAELLYILMQGTGCGFSVESRYVNQWPIVEQNETLEYMGRIADTTEGWCEAFKLSILNALLGIRQKWDYSQIRGKGEWLHTKGGRASGPEPLKQLLEMTWNVIRNRAGSKLTPFDIHRLACMAGQIVQVGGVRRSALISLFDYNDVEMANCKKGEFWHEYPELSQANNSRVYTDQPFSWDHWRELETNGTGEPGIFRRPTQLANRIVAEWGSNPCGEIILRPKQFCNLSQAVARREDTVDTLSEKVRLATIFGTIQSTLTDFNYLSKEWKLNCDDERLLGVDITGAMDCEILRPSDRLPEILQELRTVAEDTNKEYANILGIRQSVSITCNKPSGNSSQLLDCSSGIHPRYAPFYIRRIRLDADSALARYLRDVGVPFQREGYFTIEVFEFPIKSPEGSIGRRDIKDWEQFFYWRDWKQYWTSHNPSCTIYVHKWEQLGHYVKGNWEKIGGLSFLPKNDIIYKLAPYEEITEEKYNQLMAEFPELDLTQVVEKVDNTTMNSDYACESDKCVWEPKQ